MLTQAKRNGRKLAPLRHAIAQGWIRKIMSLLFSTKCGIMKTMRYILMSRRIRAL